ncbi:MAG: sigma factor SigB regulation protein RsbQ [Proteobacteria bacterium ST_bin11]|nr:MAG: sigma factor SigB regulation protein RsbQ [Proteobacteria bacterium ST_bin11]
MNKNVLQRNNVKVLGSGKQPLLFAHGFGCDQNMWRFITPAFSDNFQIVLFDYVGSGKSDVSAYDPERYSDLSGYVQDINDVIDALALENIILVGHSVSGMIGMLAAIQRPDKFQRLIMVGPSPRYINESPDYIGGFERKDIEGLFDLMDKNYLGWANFLAPAIMQNPDRPELGIELSESFCSTDPVIARQFAQATFFSDNRQDLAKVLVPSLIMQCSADIIAPLAVGEYLHQNLAQSTLRILNATGHCPHLSHPDETIDVIQWYLNTALVH